MNSTVRNSSNMPVTAQLRTACRSSLMTMGFNSHSRQLVKWVFNFEKVAVMAIENELNIELPTLYSQCPDDARRIFIGCWRFDVGCWMFPKIHCTPPFVTFIKMSSRFVLV